LLYKQGRKFRKKRRDAFHEGSGGGKILLGGGCEKAQTREAGPLNKGEIADFTSRFGTTVGGRENKEVSRRRPQKKGRESQKNQSWTERGWPSMRGGEIVVVSTKPAGPGSTP